MRGDRLEYLTLGLILMLLFAYMFRDYIGMETVWVLAVATIIALALGWILLSGKK